MKGALPPPAGTGQRGGAEDVLDLIGCAGKLCNRARNHKSRKLVNRLRCHDIYSAKDWTSLKEVNILSRFILCRNSSETNI